MWVDHKEGWVPKIWCFPMVVLEKILESPLDSEKIKPVNPKGHQPWIFIGRTDAEAPILWPHDVKSQLVGKDPDNGKDRGRKRRGQQRMRWLDGITKSMDEFAQTLVDGEWQASLVCCSSWGCKESDTTEWLNNNKNLSFRVWLYTLSRILLALLFWSSSFQAGPKNLL